MNEHQDNHNLQHMKSYNGLRLVLLFLTLSCFTNAIGQNKMPYQLFDKIGKKAASVLPEAVLDARI